VGRGEREEEREQEMGGERNVGKMTSNATPTAPTPSLSLSPTPIDPLSHAPLYHIPPPNPNP
jgi:hypothetical protein